MSTSTTSIANIAPLFTNGFENTAYDSVQWEKRAAHIERPNGEVVYHQEGIDVPVTWSQNALNITASKYFYGNLESGERESSVEQLINRVADTITEWGVQGKYLSDEDTQHPIEQFIYQISRESQVFNEELKYLLVNQYLAFNSPVWFNVGIDQTPQVSACLPYEQLVNTENGLMPIGELVYRWHNKFSVPMVFGKDAKLQKIVAVKNNGKKTVMNLVLKSGQTLRMTGNHVVFVEDASGNIVEKTASSIVVGVDRLLISRSHKLSHSNNSQFDNDDCWLAGLMVGDGYADRPSSATSDIWEIKTESPAVQQRVEEVLTRKGISYAVQNKPNITVIRGYGASGKHYWSKMSLWGHTNNKIIPSWILEAPQFCVASFLMGLFDSDGCVVPGISNGRVVVQLSNTSDDVIEKTHVLLQSMGIYSHYAITSGVSSRVDGCNRKPCYTLYIADVASVDLFDAVVSFTHDERLSKLRSRSVGQTSLKSDRVLVVDRTKGGPEIVYDIQTEDGSFWVSGILVHNCFINSVEDNLESILTLAVTEGMLFKNGSGAGVNLSKIRSSQERLTGGGTASGPVSFMRGYDAFAGVIKSGGKTRRAAKMIILNVCHPDIEEFIWCKAKEEKKAKDLISLGYDAAIDGEAYASVYFQNANHSVRVTDEFMTAASEHLSYLLQPVDNGMALAVDAGNLLHQIADAAWQCGDPGIQFDDAINRWHTCKATDRIYASNPCSEYVFLDDTACNLASLNLVKFLRDDLTFDKERFIHAVDIAITAMEILVSNASYPTELIRENSERYRPLGLGYANLGALLMRIGLPYDSEYGRATAAAITALMQGAAGVRSALIAATHGEFEGASVSRVDGGASRPKSNREHMREVLHMHYQAVKEIKMPRLGVDVGWNKHAKPGMAGRETPAEGSLRDLIITAGDLLHLAYKSPHGWRNAQFTVLAPTGTIAFMMDCDTTGIEPELSLRKTKHLVGGGVMTVPNHSAAIALQSMGREDLVKHLLEHGHLENSGLSEHDLQLFDTSFVPATGQRSIPWEAHVRMMAAVQPFLSGAISKTVNMPESATIDDIKRAYLMAWGLGVKAIAVYRDNCKGSQPMTNSETPKALPTHVLTEKEIAYGMALPDPRPTVKRRKLADERASITHKFTIGSHEGYLNVGLYEDGTPGELFINMSKEGSTLSGLMDTVAVSISMMLQYGVPLSVIVEKFKHTRFEPSGYTKHEKIRIAKSIPDYVARWLELRFLTESAPAIAADVVPSTVPIEQPSHPTTEASNSNSGMTCAECGSEMVQNGTCHACIACGSTTGCG